MDPALVNVLVRPRSGGFVYSREEIDLAAADIRAVTSHGVGGVVVGGLTAEGRLDLAALARWRDAAGSAAVVFHRAIDASPMPDAVFDALRAAGVSRVLTSGGAARSVEGIARLTAYVKRADGVEVMAGGGVAPADIPALRRAGVGAVHLSARRRTGREAPAGPGGGEEGHDTTDAELVLAAVAAARS